MTSSSRSARAPRRSAAALLVVALAAVGGAVLPASTAHAEAPFPIEDPFASVGVGTTMPAGWARVASDSGQAAIVDDGPAGKWLRLTSDTPARFGAVYNTVPYDAAAGLSVEFDARMYDDADKGYADGMSFFLQDGAVPLDRVGPQGGALGYYADIAGACSVGLPGGIIGLGFDRYGNFSKRQTPNALTIRGAQDDCYPELATTGDRGTGFLESRGTTAADAPYRHVQLSILPTDGATADVVVSMSDPTPIGSSWSTMTKYLDTDVTVSSIPDQVRLGFAASTGQSAEYHEVRSIAATQPTDVSTTVTTDARGPLLPGDTVTATIHTRSSGPARIGGADDAFARTAADLSALHLDGVSWRCSAVGSASCVTRDGTGDHLAVDWTGSGASGIDVVVTGRVAGSAPVGAVSASVAAVTDFDRDVVDPTNAAVTKDRSVSDVDLANNAADLSLDLGLEQPSATDDSATTGQAQPVTVDVAANDEVDRTGTDPTTVRLTDRGLDGATLGDDGRTLTVPGEGTYTVERDGRVVVTPVASFIGAATPVTYLVSSHGGQTAEARLRVTVTGAPVAAADDSASTAQGVATSIDVLGNDTPDPSGFDPGSVVLTDASATRKGKHLDVDGVGSFDVRAGGTVDFTPAPSFIGSTPSVGYAATTRAGQSVRASIVVDVTAVAVAGNDDMASTRQGVAATVDVLANDEADPSGFDPSSVTITRVPDGGTIADAGKRATLPGVGAYAVLDDGAVTFTPVVTFIGTTPAVRYAAATRAGQRVHADLRVQVDAGAVTANDDRATTGQGAPVDVDVLANDVPDVSGFSPSTLELLGPDGERGVDRLDVPGVGTWTVTDGRLRFAPVPAFIGEVAPVGYAVETRAGQRVRAAAAVTVTAAQVAGTDDHVQTPQGAAVQLDVLANDSADPSGFDADSVRLTDAGDGGAVVLPGQGTFDVVGDRVRFVPLDTFIGTTTPVGYTARTEAGQVVRAAVTVTTLAASVSASDDELRTGQGQPGEVSPLDNDSADPSGFDPDSVRFTDPRATAGGTRLELAGQGTWTILRDTIRFEPEVTLIGPTAPVGYTAATRAGQHVSAQVTGQVAAAPVAADDDQVATQQGSPVSVDVLANDSADPSGFDPASLAVAGADEGGALTLDGVGTFAVERGSVVFSPVDTFIGTTGPVVYSAATHAGQRVEATLVVDVVAAPVAGVDDVVATDQGVAVQADVVANDVADPSGFDLGTLRLRAVTGGTVGDGGRSLEVPGQGAYRVTDTGRIAFEPEPRLIGDARAVPYELRTRAGQRVRAELVVHVRPAPVAAAPDEASTRQGRPTTVDVLANDLADPSGWDAATIGLAEPSGTGRSRTGSEVVVDGQGTWSVVDGRVRFSPVDAFIGVTDPVTYAVATVAGQRVSSTVTVRVDAAPVSGTDDTAATVQGSAVRIDVLANDQTDPSGFDPASLAVTASSAGDGSWSVVDGVVAYQPSRRFVGTASAGYTVETRAGQSVHASVAVTVHAVGPRTSDDEASTPYEEPVTIDVLGNDVPGVDGGTPIDPDRLTLVDGRGVETDVVTTDAGVFRVVDGRVRFVPAPGMSGAVPAVAYRAYDTAGAPGVDPATGRDAVIRVTVERRALAFTGTDAAVVVVAGSVLLVAGLLLVLLGARRRRHGQVRRG